MEFSAVNRRRPSRETPLGPGAKKDGCFRRLHWIAVFRTIVGYAVSMETPLSKSNRVAGTGSCC